MVIPQLPEIKLTCRDGHAFTSRARGGSSVSCPVCRRNGRRISVWVPASRPKTAREVAALAAEHEDQDHEPGRELAARWAAEPHWDGRQLPDWPGRPVDRCLACGGPLTWEPGRTWTDCDACAEGEGGVQLPAAVIAHYQRAEVATRSAGTVATRADPAAEQAARVRLRALKDGLKQRLESWLDTIADPDSYDRVQHERQARELAAMLGAWLPEINAAVDEPALAATWGQIDALVSGELGRALSAEYEQAQARARQQHEVQQRAAEHEQYRRELAEQQEQEQREAGRAAREAEQEQARQRKAITSGSIRIPVTNIGAGMQGLAFIATGIERREQEKARRLAAHGACGYTDQHRKPEIAVRRYWIMALDWQGNDSGYAVPGAPEAVVCKKHFVPAWAWITEQASLLAAAQNYARVRAVYTELT